jgi:CheY-like chemotaxis protein/HPt (histidine-containing phosphotransfer) domain-containing protein
MHAGDTPTALATADDPLRGATPIPVRPSHEYDNYRFLVVDDNIINCQVAVHMLVKLGCHADAAMNSRDAIDMHQRQRYDLILMDCQMPGLDGCQTTEQIRSAETDNQRTAIIGWTSTLQSEEKERCFAAGMDDLLGKPIRTEMLREMIERWLRPGTSLLAPLSDVADNALESTHKRLGAHFAELAALYRTDTLLRISAMHAAAAECDNGKIATIAHVLGGSCASIGAMHLSAMCRELENYCRTALPDNLDCLLKDIEDEFQRTDSIIRTLLQSATL